MLPSKHRLLEFLSRARAVGLRRRAMISILDLLLAAAAIALLGLLVTTFSLRGDLGSAGIALAWAAALGGTGYRIWRAIAVDFGSLHQTARVVARTPGPLDDKREAGAGAVLRHEVLAATELLGGLDGDAAGKQHLGSKSLASSYVASVGERVASRQPALAVPPARYKARLLVLAGVGAAAALMSLFPAAALAAQLLLSGLDGRPPQPPQPVWSALDLSIEYPEHTGRPTRRVPNPSGALRVPAGTVISLDMETTVPAQFVRVVVNYDSPELTNAYAPETFALASDTGGTHWTGAFTARGSGTWTIVLLDDEDEAPSRRSPSLPLELEPDAPPEVELLPLPPSQREPDELGRVDVRFTARDDFGLMSATLVYQMEDGEIFRLPAGKAPDSARQWRRRHTWDLSSIPIEKRSELSYWIEVRDNDPGLGLDPLPDPPGKVAASAKQRLSVRDREQEHSRNIQGLRELRDMAVDLLARRLTTVAFTSDATPKELDLARAIHSESHNLLAAFATLIDDLSIDTMVRERDVAGFIGIHKRLLELNRKENKLHTKMPPGGEFKYPARIKGLLVKLRPHNKKEVVQLEDEIIRLDDLVDTQIIERLERLLDRAETTLQKLIELLDQYEAGDESVLPQIQQLEQRLREDLRRISEARALLRKELGSEFMNLDALRRLEQQLEQMNMGNMLGDGKTKDARQRAMELRQQLMQMRGAVQNRASENVQLSEEDRMRMQLLRELGRLKDEQKTLQGETKQLHQAWREAVADEKAQDPQQAGRKAKTVREDLEKINDARLGRDARRGWEDAREELQKLENMAKEPDAKALQEYEAAQKAVEALDKALKGSKPDEKEGKAIRRLKKRAEALRNSALGRLPTPGESLQGESLERYRKLEQQQQTLRQRAGAMMQERMSSVLPKPGRQAMKSADRGMERSAESLDQTDGGRSMQGQQRSLDGIQRAIDSLRRQSPPPQATPTGEASTEAERDRSWRDQLMDAMREEAPEGFDEEVDRYYEELLK